MKKFIIAATLMLFAGWAHAADLGGKVLRIGSDTTYPPMEMVDEKTGEIIGFDVDLVDAICERINCVPQFVTTAWDGIFAALQQGEFDMVVSGVSITPERDKQMDFSDPYLVVSQAIMVRIDDEGLEAADDGELKIESSIIACQDLTDGDNLPISGKTQLAWLQESNDTYQTLEAGEDPTAASNANLEILNGFYSLPLADMKLGGAAPTVTPAEGRAYIGAVTEDDDWTANWAFGLDPANSAAPLWFE